MNGGLLKSSKGMQRLYEKKGLKKPTENETICKKYKCLFEKT